MVFLVFFLLDFVLFSIVVVVVVAVVVVVVVENPGKKSKIFENFPVAPGRPLGYPGRPTGKFSIFFLFFEFFPEFFSWIFRRKRYPQSGALTPKARGQRTTEPQNSEKPK